MDGRWDTVLHGVVLAVGCTMAWLSFVSVAAKERLREHVVMEFTAGVAVFAEQPARKTCCNSFVQGAVASSLTQGFTVQDPLGHRSAGRHRYSKDFHSDCFVVVEE
ncbi:hypothetical protein NL676_022241 [Syzygium grande]|nr:hypothetical protein NL676_022241 [Syzygium grande]